GRILRRPAPIHAEPVRIESRRRRLSAASSLALAVTSRRAMSFTLAIVGRPNVGKSTLFNRLVGARRALVNDQPGVTRDRREGEGKLGDLSFKVIDTAGLEDANRDQESL